MMNKKEIYRIFGVLLVSFLCTGLIFNFDFTTEANIQLHDTYFVLIPWHLTLIVWIIVIFIIYVIRVVIEKFKNRLAIWILLFVNSVMTGLIVLIAYVAYSFFTADALADLFRDSKRIEIISEQFYWTMATCGVLFVTFVFAGIYFIKKLKRLKNPG
jgi:hypothetical protein